VRASGLAGKSLAEIQRALLMRGRVGRAHAPDRDACAALPVRMMTLVLSAFPLEERGGGGPLTAA